jgi:hypothetical protein
VRQRRGTKKGDGGETDRWGRLVSETKEKKKEPGPWAAAGRRLVGCWAAGPEGKNVSFLFFSFLFQTLFNPNF